ncbi:MAG: MAPEG family protein [Pseudomonadota bacterium]
MPLPITALYAGPLAIWILVLTFGVVRVRRKNLISLGHAENKQLEQRIRGHGNAVETIPIALILLGLAEGLGTPALVLHLLGLLLVAGRVMHGIHFLQGRQALTFRFYGMLLTIIAIALLALGVFAHGVADLV